MSNTPTTSEWTDKSIGHAITHMAKQIDLLQLRVSELESAMPCPHRETEEDYSFDGESENRIEVCTACGETL